MKYKTDVFVIGSGGAGLRTAIEAHDKDLDVLVLGKCKRGDAHTVMATGGINASLGTMDTKDNWLVHAVDTLKEGRFIADPNTVETLCKLAPDAVNELIEYGVNFHREKDGRLTQRFFGAHRYRRTCFVGDETGKAIEMALGKEVKKRGINFLGEVYITHLLTQGKTVNGAFGFDMNTGDLIVVNAKAVVLATGGHSRLYKRSSSRMFEGTGDGIALAYKVGATLEDMEMIQFHPTGMVWPPKADGILVTEAVRGEGGILLNAKDERFMRHYHPRAELGPRDVVARAIYSEINLGRGTKHNGVWLDITHLPKAYIKERLPKMYRQFKEYSGIDISKQKMEVAPTAHYSMGGVRVDRKTYHVHNLKGLFAIGEVTSGVHGANRLGGNSLLELVVFGKLSGNSIASYVREHDFMQINRQQIEHSTNELHKLLNSKGRYKPKEIRAEIQEMMWESLGIVRNRQGLMMGLNRLSRIRAMLNNVKVNGKNFAHNENFVVALDVKGLLIPAEAVIRSALAREESRGAHYRSDYTEEKRVLYNVFCRKGEKGMVIGKRRIAEGSSELAKALSEEAKIKIEHKLLE